MKATGIVRRIDDLGRVVIPKEIRRTLRIREGDPHYITLTVEEKLTWIVMMKKFVPTKSMSLCSASFGVLNGTAGVVVNSLSF